MNEKHTLDLSKLAPLELPEETIEVELRGDVSIDEATGEKKQNIQKITIHPLSGRGLIAWSNNGRNSPENVAYEERACLTALIYGADLPEEDAIRLMDCDRTTANKISLAVWLATSSWHKALREERVLAEKNSETAGTNTDA